MTEAEKAAVDLMAQQCGTVFPRDLAAQVVLIRGASDRAYAVARVLEARAAWRTYLTVSQRKWQGGTRRPSRARHHDSVSLREKYVRCGS